MAAHFGQGLAGRPICGAAKSQVARQVGRMPTAKHRRGRAWSEYGYGLPTGSSPACIFRSRVATQGCRPRPGPADRERRRLAVSRLADSPHAAREAVRLGPAPRGGRQLLAGHAGRAGPDRGRGRAVRRDRARPDRTGGRAAAAGAHQSRRMGDDRAAASDPPAPAGGRARKAPGPRPMSRSATGSRRGSRERSTTSWSTSPRSGSSRAGPGSACGARAISSRSTSRVPEDAARGPGADPCGDRRSSARRPAAARAGCRAIRAAGPAPSAATRARTRPC